MIRDARAYKIGDQSALMNGLDALLRGLGLLLAIDDRNQRDMDLQEVVPPRSSPQLTHGLSEQMALDVANRSTKLNDADIGFLLGVIDRYPCHTLDPVLRDVREVWHDLNSSAEVIAPALALYDVPVHYKVSRVQIKAVQGRQRTGTSSP